MVSSPYCCGSSSADCSDVSFCCLSLYSVSPSGIDCVKTSCCSLNDAICASFCSVICSSLVLFSNVSTDSCFFSAFSPEPNTGVAGNAFDVSGIFLLLVCVISGNTSPVSVSAVTPSFIDIDANSGILSEVFFKF